MDPETRKDKRENYKKGERTRLISTKWSEVPGLSLPAVLGWAPLILLSLFWGSSCHVHLWVLRGQGSSEFCVVPVSSEMYNSVVASVKAAPLTSVRQAH